MFEDLREDYRRVAWRAVLAMNPEDTYSAQWVMEADGGKIIARGGLRMASWTKLDNSG